MIVATSMSKKIVLMKKTIMLIVIARKLKFLAILLLVVMLVTKIKLKILLVKNWNSILTMTLQIRQIFMY